jgi:hypothetical protein
MTKTPTMTINCGSDIYFIDIGENWKTIINDLITRIRPKSNLTMKIELEIMKTKNYNYSLDDNEKFVATVSKFEVKI